MISRSGFARATWLLACVLAAAGCGPISESSVDEQREPHFLNGKARLQALDFPGAVESFEKALEVNPRNASVHFELGLLCDDDRRPRDHAAAIYHFERYLRLRPDSPHARHLGERITACKQELARTVSLAPVTQTMQREFEKLAAENLQLKQQVQQLQELLNRKAAEAAVAASPAGGGASGPLTTTRPPAPLALNSTAPRSPSASISEPPPAPRPKAKTYVVQKNDTPTAIARKFGVKVDALLAANPGLDPRRLRLGQTLNIPAP